MTTRKPRKKPVLSDRQRINGALKDITEAYFGLESDNEWMKGRYFGLALAKCILSKWANKK